MRNRTRTSVVAALLSTFLLLTGPVSRLVAQAGGAEVLTNESVTQMITGKVPKDLIVTKIRTTKANFDITPSGLVALNANKVPGDIIKLMLQSAGNSKDAKETLNNDAVVQMVNGQLSKDIIVTKIQMSRADYDLTTSGIISLNQNKVSQDVVKAMMTASSMTPAPAVSAPPAKKPEESAPAKPAEAAATNKTATPPPAKKAAPPPKKKPV
jgi:hypothetical protein